MPAQWDSSTKAHAWSLLEITGYLATWDKQTDSIVFDWYSNSCEVTGFSPTELNDETFLQKLFAETGGFKS